VKEIVSVKQIDALLPQTQCGLCGFSGCLPYANSLAKGESPINLCTPGGIKGVKQLATLLSIDSSPYLETFKEKEATKLLIDETSCIGCTKCISACPVDAIIGASKQMHTIIQAECTGCDLCIPACPVDCIEISTSSPLKHLREEKSAHYRQKYSEHKTRLENANNQQKNSYRDVVYADLDQNLAKINKTNLIQEALSRKG
jgi:electron transport complex protein RnfB